MKKTLLILTALAKKLVTTLLIVAILGYVAWGLFRMGYLEGQIDERLWPTLPRLNENFDWPETNEIDRITHDLKAISILLYANLHGHWAQYVSTWADKTKEMVDYCEAHPEKAYVPNQTETP
jgi:hypothetical protein